MLNNVIAGIAIALNQEFGDDYEIYTEEIKQDLKEPCFFITLLNPSKTDFPSKRYLMDNPFCIQYFPESEDNPNSECRDVADRMLWRWRILRLWMQTGRYEGRTCIMRLQTEC